MISAVFDFGRRSDSESVQVNLEAVPRVGEYVSLFDEVKGIWYQGPVTRVVHVIEKTIDRNQYVSITLQLEREA